MSNPYRQVARIALFSLGAILLAVFGSKAALYSAPAAPATPAQSVEDSEGEWTMRSAKASDKVRFSLHKSWDEGGQFNSSFDVKQSEFTGLDTSVSERRNVRFSLNRDAGTLECDGFLQGARGAGLFEFAPNPRYAAEMAALGFEIDQKRQFSAAIHDVSLQFAREMADAKLEGLDANKLLAFRIHGVSKKFIDEIRRGGLSVSDSNDLIAFRIHGVSPEFVRAVKDLGYEPRNKDLISMRIHGATPKWIRQLDGFSSKKIPLKELISFRIHNVSPEFVGDLKKLGYSNPSPKQLVSFRIHNVTPEFVGELKKLGYSNPSPQELVSMKIHNVTPAFIRDLKKRGVKDLSVQQLVGMKIHGLDQ